MFGNVSIWDFGNPMTNPIILVFWGWIISLILQDVPTTNTFDAFLVPLRLASFGLAMSPGSSEIGLNGNCHAVGLVGELPIP